METIADLVRDGRERDATLFSTGTDATDYTYETFLTTVWKAGNLLRHYGVRPGDSVAVAVGPDGPAETVEARASGESTHRDAGRLGASPTPLLAILGGMTAGASVVLDPVTAVEAKALVAPTAWLSRYTPGPGTKPIGYGQEATEPTVAQFEREAWSENAVAPPVELDPTTKAIGGSNPLAHGDLVAATRRIGHEYGMTAGDRVRLDAPVTPGALVAGVLAPTSAGATVFFRADDVPSPAADFVVTCDEPVETNATRIDPTAVFGDAA